MSTINSLVTIDVICLNTFKLISLSSTKSNAGWSLLSFPASAAGFEDSPALEGGKLVLTGKYSSNKCRSLRFIGTSDPRDRGDDANKLCGEFRTSYGIERGVA
jgi:hypothetical protein